MLWEIFVVALAFGWHWGRGSIPISLNSFLLQKRKRKSCHILCNEYAAPLSLPLRLSLTHTDTHTQTCKHAQTHTHTHTHTHSCWSREYIYIASLHFWTHHFWHHLLIWMFTWMLTYSVGGYSPETRTTTLSMLPFLGESFPPIFF